MGAELGRISGPLLSADLLRNGIDLAFDTDLLYLDVTNGRIGIKSDIPNRPLTVQGTANTTNLISNTSLTVGNFIVSTNRIQHSAGEIYISPNQTSDPTILITTVETDNLRVTDQLIENFTADSTIEISPNGLGIVNFYTDKVNITGNLHTTGNITLDGNIIFGSDDQDSVTFNSDITSNMVPDITATYDLGTDLKQWNTLFVNQVVADSVEVDNIVVNGINLTLMTGNTIYVSINGSNDNLGTHYSDPVRTLKHALSIASSGTEVVVFSGDYQEQFPLTIPQGVSVKGAGIRAVSITPTVETSSNDAFLLNGETTVSHLTVTGFDAPGYAFKFAPNMTVSTRSPYIQHVTVITQDPLAGNGALADGSVVNTASLEASMLFHAVTMIVPGAVGVSATNGARVEWLNSFTYFADTGIYLLDGTLGFAGENTRFGAEIRSVSSANVYGNYGVIADGEHTLAYLIGHNFGYVGSGINSSNDRSLAIQANEIVELNNGTIYFDSMDHKGDYRVGDIFYVNQETGVVSFDAQSINFGAQGNITLEGLDGSTVVNKDFVQSGNIRFVDNTIASLLGPINISSFDNVATLNTDVNIAKDLFITGNFNIAGSEITFGDQLSDTVTIVNLLTQTIKPNVTNLYTLGADIVGDPRAWNTLYIDLLDVDAVTQISNNTISILATDTDLVLDTAGTGKVVVEATDVDITNNLIVNADLTISGTSLVNGISTTSIIQTGNFNQTGSADIVGDTQSNNILVTDTGSYLQLPGLLFGSINPATGIIAGRGTDVDLIISATTAGKVYIPFNDVLIDNNLSVGGTLNVTSTSAVTDIDLTGNITLLGSYNLTGNFDTTGTVESNSITATADSVLILPRITINGSNILGTFPNADVGFVAAGSGRIYIPSNNVVIDNNLLVNGSLEVENTSALFEDVTANNITLVGNYNQTGNTRVDGILQAGALVLDSNSYLDVGNFRIQNQTIAGKLIDGDVVYTADGTGVVKIGQTIYFDSLEIGTTAAQSLISETNEIFIAENGEEFVSEGVDVDVDIQITPVDGNLVIDSRSFLLAPSSNSVVHTLTTAGEIRFNTTSSTDSTIIDGGTSESTVFESVIDGGNATDRNHEISGGNATTTNTTSIIIDGGTSESTIFESIIAGGDASGIDNDISGGNATTIYQVSAVPGSEPTEVYGLEGYAATGSQWLMNVFSSNRQTGIFEENNTINFFTTDKTIRSYIDQTGWYTTTALELGNFNIVGTTISNKSSTTDSTLTVSGTGSTFFNNNKLDTNNFYTPPNGALVLSNTGVGYVKFNDTNGVQFGVGSDLNHPATPETGTVRYNTDLEYSEVYDTSVGWIPLSGQPLSADDYTGVNNLWALILG